MMVIAIVIVENDGGIITEESEFFAISIIDSTGIIDRAREGNGIGGAVPIHRQAKGVGNGAYRQIGGAIDDEGSHNRAVGIFGGNERAIEIDADPRIRSGEGLGRHCRSSGGSGGSGRRGGRGASAGVGADAAGMQVSRITVVVMVVAQAADIIIIAVTAGAIGAAGMGQGSEAHPGD